MNLLPAETARAFTSRSENAAIPQFFGSRPEAGTSIESLLSTMGACGVELAVLTGALSGGTDDLLDVADKHPGRFLVSAVVDKPRAPVEMARAARRLAGHDAFRLVRVTPLVEQLPLNDRRYYPVYATCAELGLPVSVNVGIPGPRVRSGCQDPVLLEDLLIDFPDLVVIGAHMGHPYEALLITYMLKWPNLYLSNSAYLAKYMDPALVRFMGSSRGRGRVLFASDHPFLPMDRAVEAARALALDEGAMVEFLGGAARRLLGRSVS